MGVGDTPAAGAFAGKIGKTIADSTPHWPPGTQATRRRAQHSHRLVRRRRLFRLRLLRLADRHADHRRLAGAGLRYTGFHTTAMCSTTRAALLTGRNHHSVGMGCLANFDSGYPGYRGKIAREAGTLPRCCGRTAIATTWSASGT